MTAAGGTRLAGRLLPLAVVATLTAAALAAHARGADGVEGPASTAAAAAAASGAGAPLDVADTSSLSARAATAPQASTVPVKARVGPLFPHGLSGSHSCTASVVDSPSGDVIATAAHCLSGSAKGLVFAPGYSKGKAPYGTWVVTGAYVEARWLTSQSPLADYAFLTVRPSHGSASAESKVGGTRLAIGRSGGNIVAAGYAAGTGGAAISCASSVHLTGAYPTFDCGGFVDGTSGSPFLAASHGSVAVIGLIGGLHQGGCVAQTSYSSPFTAATAAVLARAERGARPDVLPRPGGDGC